MVGRGGSLYVSAQQARTQSAAGLSIEGTLFRSSTAGSGGGGAVFVNVSSGGCAAVDATAQACLSVTLRNTSFLNCSAALGGDGGGLAATLSGPSLALTACRFEGCSAERGRGGGAFVESTGITSVSDTQFVSNAAGVDPLSGGGGGGGLAWTFAAAGVGQLAAPGLELSNCLFFNNSVGSGSQGAAGQSVGGGGGLLAGPAAGLSASVAVSLSRFKGNFAPAGGGASVMAISTATVLNCSFDSNQATSTGGGLLLQGVQQAWLEHVGFTSNAAAVGGGLCVSTGASQQQTSTARSLLSSAPGNAIALVLADFFLNNNTAYKVSGPASPTLLYAGYGGGIFLSLSVAAALIRGSFQGNSASEFGPGVATLQDMGSCSRGDQQLGRSNPSPSAMVELINAAGELVTEHPTAGAYLSFGASGGFGALQSTPAVVAPLFLGYAFWEVALFRGWVGSGYRLNVTVRFTDTTAAEMEITPLSLEVELMPCPLGSSIQAGPAARPDQTSCQPCRALQFSLWVDPRNSSSNAVESFSNATLAAILEKGVCHPCPSDAYCPGGAVVVPLAGFWQSAANSTLMQRCFIREACTPSPLSQPVNLSPIGSPASSASGASASAAADVPSAPLVACQQAWYASQPPGARVLASLNASGSGEACLLWGEGSANYSSVVLYTEQQCAPSYSGRLCATCQPGSYLTTVFACKGCSTQGATVVLGIVALLATTALILFTAWIIYNNDYMRAETGPVSASDKLLVLITHMQYLIIIARLNLSWPDVITRMASALSALTGIPSLTFPVTCLLSGLDSAGQARAQYAWSFLSPIIATLLAMVLWSLRYAFYNQSLLRRGARSKDVEEKRRRWATNTLASLQPCDSGAISAIPSKAGSTTAAPVLSRGSEDSGVKQPSAQQPLAASPSLQPQQSESTAHKPAAATKVPSTRLEGKPSVQTSRLSGLSASLRKSTRVFTTVEPSAAIVHLDQGVSLPRQLVLLLLVAITILYPGLAHASLSSFACRRLDTGAGPYPETQQATWRYGYWLSDMNQECYLGVHRSFYAPLGAVCVFVFCIAPPLGILVLVLRRRKKLGQPKTRAVYGFLYHRYREDFYFFESVKQLQVLMLVLVNVFANAIFQYQQALLLLCVLLCIGVVNMSCRALRAKLLVLLEYLSLMVLALSITLGLFFVGGGAGSEMGLDSQAAEDAVAVIILVLNSSLLVALALVIAWPALVRLWRPAQKPRDPTPSTQGQQQGEDDAEAQQDPPPLQGTQSGQSNAALSGTAESPTAAGALGKKSEQPGSGDPRDPQGAEAGLNPQVSIHVTQVSGVP
ncbi:hypothetical protein HYH03_014351 [Edaphochlamys debaryana]|uniref:TRP C-terminal domain-containing protein n=1 Tax=Edaphochlamys debaryana TaxID=47281 RepID=A0A835XMU7_9CHLO|nr:hypothetical protein HYH03_014351 [Edaphochlamys debaryana]|eukprot:KAG2486978.1 hypothetical protein HYH03_014351 [Edaphochlamys debaryana]